MSRLTGMAVLSDIPQFTALSASDRERLLAMCQDMDNRGLPSEIVASGLRSTAALMLEHKAQERSRFDSDEVRDFLQTNAGKAVSRSPRSAPRRESKTIAREKEQERLTGLLGKARSARRRHEIMSVRRELLALDQAHIRRNHGTEGDAFCAETNDWLIAIAARLNRGAL